MKITTRRALAVTLVAMFAAGCSANLVTQPDPAPAAAGLETLESAATGVEKVTICHIPPGNPENQHTIVVGAPAVPAHLEHGDFLGECAPQCLMSVPGGTVGAASCLIGE